jgi:radical SAM protein with 4Fe4S-binding SPASM domain
MPYHSLQDCVEQIGQHYDVVCKISCDYSDFNIAQQNLYYDIAAVYSPVYKNDQRLIFTITEDFYHSSQSHGIILDLLQSILNDLDIPNYFICLISTNNNIVEEYKAVHQKWNQDPNPINLIHCTGNYSKKTADRLYLTGKMHSLKKILPVIQKLNQTQKQRLFGNDSFCIMPWLGIHVGPDSQVRPCCDSKLIMGKVSNQSLDEIWNSPPTVQLRAQLLNNQQPQSCQTCYVKEQLGTDSLRKSINREFAHCIEIVDNGPIAENLIKYWDIRYNNLCNFTCRSCDPVSSSSWTQVYNDINPTQPRKTLYLEAGNDQDQIYQQIIQHLDQVEKIYFAGGEPSMIENFYHILDLLEQRQRYEVKLIYNMNLSRLKLKHWNLVDMWQKFPNVSIGASLDAEGLRAEYLRSGTVWTDIITNRKILQEKCSHIDFWISATTSLINALHLPDFHQSWTEQGLISAEQFAVQVLFTPEWMSIKNAPQALKQKIIARYQQHLEWLKPQDSLGRSTSGFSSIIELCKETGNYDPKQFWDNVNKLDRYHDVALFDYYPELVDCGL